MTSTRAEVVARSLAADADLFDLIERRCSTEYLRLWESPHVAVIVGRSTVVASEVDEDCCRRDNVPILRRTSGGGAVVIGPGCLNYSLFLSLAGRPQMQSVPDSYKAILGGIVATLRVDGLEVRTPGDLALDDRKVSGSAQRRGRYALLHHGTFLHDFDLPLISRYLTTPIRQPPYRRGRSHLDFVRNLPLSAGAIRTAVVQMYEKVENWAA